MPPPGTALLMPLDDGRFGVCRVLRLSSEEEVAYQGAVQALVAMSPWIGEELPDIRDPRLREIHALTHHSFKEAPCVLWVAGPPPDSFRVVGEIEPTPEEAERPCSGSSAWPWFPLQLIAQWRWDHERVEVHREDESKRAKVEAANRNAAQQYREYLDSLTLEDLLNRTWFEGWKGFVPAKALRACRETVRRAIQGLIDLGPNPGAKSVVRILRDCVHEINAIDDQNGNFIETVAREDLSEAFDEIAHAAGLRVEAGVALRWADW